MESRTDSISGLPRFALTRSARNDDLNGTRNAELNAKFVTDSNCSRIQNAECADISRGEFVLCEQALAFAVERKWNKAALVSKAQNRPRDGGDGESEHTILKN